MIERTEERFGLKPNRLLGDGAYGNAELLGWMVDEKDIAPHVTLLDTPGRPTSRFTQKDFTYHNDRDVFTCTGGKELRQFWWIYKIPRSGITKDKKRLYRSRNTDCKVCDLKDKCCPTSPFKKVGRSTYEHARDEFLLAATVQNLRKLTRYT